MNKIEINNVGLKNESSFLDILRDDVSFVDLEIENLIPKKMDDWIEDVIGKSKWKYDVFALEGSISKLVWDLLERGGKRWRPFLMKLCFNAVSSGGGSVNIDNFLSLPEIIHNGTLMIDDVEDNSDFRRGKPCIHKIYGNDLTINAGNAMYFLPMLKIIKSDLDIEVKVRIYELIHEEMIKLSFGQGMDIFWHGGNGIPNEDEYLQMCAFKTGTLARMAAKLGGILAGADDKTIEVLGDFAESLGVAFQIQDDILNICPGEDWGKDFGDDISEGKRTLLVIRALKTICSEDAKDLIGILNLKTKNKIIIGEAIGILKNSGSLEYASDFARNLVREAWGKLDLVLRESKSKDKLKMFCDFVVERDI